MQLNLFQWDLIETGNGYSSLAQLDFAQARQCFARVLEARPNYSPAVTGLQSVRYWERVLQSVAARQGEGAIALFWEKFKGFTFGTGELDREFRLSLLKRLQALMRTEGVDFLPPDLCQGYLALQAGDYDSAENQLRRLVDAHPRAALLHGYLADTLWLQGRRQIANGLYTLAFLLDPEGMKAHPLRNQSLAALAAECKADMVPALGYLAKILPLVDHETAADSSAMQFYAALCRAEKARFRGDHPAMVAARLEMQARDAETFAAYLRFMREEEKIGAENTDVPTRR